MQASKQQKNDTAKMYCGLGNMDKLAKEEGGEKEFKMIHFRLIFFLQKKGW